MNNQPLINENKWNSTHRPWPLPRIPWVMKQSWNNLLFINYAVSLELLKDFIPKQLPIDTYNGMAWISVVPFKMENVAARGIPYSIAFPELNVRTYIIIDNKPGVYFFSLDASHLFTVLLAKTFIKLPYFHAHMDINLYNNETSFTSQRTKQSEIKFNCEYNPVSEPFLADHNTLEHWLTERYCFYITTASGTVKRCDILHEPWPLQHAEMTITTNSNPLLKQLNINHSEPVIYYSKGVDVRVWPLVTV